jgi:hypothetical protein
MVLNLDKWNARLRKIPQAAKDAVEAALHTEADDLVAAMKRAAPVDEKETPGRFRDSIRWEPNAAGAELKVTVIADPKDEDGHGYAPHLEHGHKARDGSHVPAQPSFFPTYRARKKGMKRRIGAAGRKAVRALFPV